VDLNQALQVQAGTVVIPVNGIDNGTFGLLLISIALTRRGTARLTAQPKTRMTKDAVLDRGKGMLDCESSQPHGS
jgi:hypothetical protein